MRLLTAALKSAEDVIFPEEIKDFKLSACSKLIKVVIALGSECETGEVSFLQARKDAEAIDRAKRTWHMLI